VIRRDCINHVDEVTQQIPTVIFSAKDSSGADLSDVKVTADGETFTTKLDGVALAVDPGKHTFTFTTDGQPPITKTFVLQEGQHDRRELIAFGSSAAKPTAPSLLPPQPGRQPPPAPPPADEHPGRTQKTLALVAGGVGIVGLGLGATFGILAATKKSDAEKVCPSQTECPTQDGVSQWNTVVTDGNIATIGFIVGGVGVAAAVVLWLTAPSSGRSSSQSAQVILGPGSLQLKGTW
jgi:hypothetical protein